MPIHTSCPEYEKTQIPILEDVPDCLKEVYRKRNTSNDRQGYKLSNQEEKLSSIGGSPMAQIII